MSDRVRERGWVFDMRIGGKCLVWSGDVKENTIYHQDAEMKADSRGCMRSDTGVQVEHRRLGSLGSH